MRHTEEGKYEYDENEYAEYDCNGLTAQVLVTNSVKHCGGLLNDAMGAVSRNVCCCFTVFDLLICFLLAADVVVVDFLVPRAKPQ